MQLAESASERRGFYSVFSSLLNLIKIVLFSLSLSLSLSFFFSFFFVSFFLLLLLSGVLCVFVGERKAE